MNGHAPLRSKESTRVAFEPVRVGLVAVGQPPVKHPSGVVRWLGVRGAASSVNDLVFLLLDDLGLRVCLMSQSNVR